MAKKTTVDFILDEDYARYNELLNMAEEAKAAAPKAERKPRGPLTQEQKIKMADARLAKAKAVVDALLAAQNG